MRDYDLTLGRYIQADPLGLVDGVSLYSYVRQNPNRHTDFRGERIDPSNPMDLGERAGRSTQDCEVASLGDYCKKFAKKLRGLPKIFALACGVAFGADDNPNTNFPRRGGREQSEPRPGGAPPREDEFTNQPIEPPKRK